MTETVELKPCPFCGSNATLYHRDGGYGWSNTDWVGCDNEDCGARTCLHETEANTVAAWNTRSDPAVRDRVTDEAAMSDAARWVIENYGRDTPVDALALTLFEAWCKAEPTSGPATYPASYLATFSDMARAAIRTSPPEPASGLPTHRHKKRGTEYVLIGIGKMQAENWTDQHREYHPESGEPPKLTWSRVDMREVAVYRSATDPAEIWVRPREEFEDGRFEPPPATPAKEPQ